jgi:uncharacterized membrane protein
MVIQNSENEEIFERLKQLEERLARIEAHLNLAPESKPELMAAPAETVATETEEKFELQLGQNWFAKVGIVILALGVVFLLTFPYQNLPPALPSLAGYLLVGAILGLARYLRTMYQLISRYLLGGGLLLLYFTTLRLAHFSPEPAITSVPVEVFLLMVVVAINLVVAARRQSPNLAGISLALGYFTALVGGDAYFVFAVVSGMSVVAVYFQRRYHWNTVSAIGIVLAFLTHVTWAINNPVFGNQIQLVSTPELNLLFILLYAVIFATGYLLREHAQEEQPLEVLSSFVNGAGSYGLILALTLTSFASSVVAWHVLASVVYLVLAVAFWIRRRSSYATFIYAMLGYTALSAAIIAQFKMPDFFVWLCWQSIVVVSTAVWFRSRFIVVGNFAIFVIVFMAYLFTTGSISIVSASFGVVALLSARILNWKRDRLELKTEMMRNAYLASALFVIPYALYHTVPSGYVSLSWLCVAAAYYVFSRLLHNRKYRWMALLTTGLTILYVFVVDLVGVNPTFRIISFLVLGTALLGISMVYSRRKQRGEERAG